MKKLHLVSTGLAIIGLMASYSTAQAWPLKHEKKPDDQQIYPIGPDADGLYTTRSGLKFKDLTKGEGPRPHAGQTVTVHYTGWLTNGEKFDSSVDRGQPFDFVLGAGKVIKGWDEGVRGMHIGGKRRLEIPPNLGYGEKGAGNSIPPNAKLIFEVELLSAK